MIFKKIPTDLPLLCFYEKCKYIEIFARFYDVKQNLYSAIRIQANEWFILVNV